MFLLSHGRVCPQSQAELTRSTEIVMTKTGNKNIAKRVVMNNSFLMSIYFEHVVFIEMSCFTPCS